jgi:hypothetical protein
MRRRNRCSSALVVFSLFLARGAPSAQQKPPTTASKPQIAAAPEPQEKTEVFAALVRGIGTTWALDGGRPDQ